MRFQQRLELLLQSRASLVGIDHQQNRIIPGAFWPATSWCIVDLPDLATFCSFWLVSTGSPEVDFNNSGRVDLLDYNTLATYWLRMYPDAWPWW